MFNNTVWATWCEFKLVFRVENKSAFYYYTHISSCDKARKHFDLILKNEP